MVHPCPCITLPSSLQLSRYKLASLSSVEITHISVISETYLFYFNIKTVAFYISSMFASNVPGKTQLASVIQDFLLPCVNYVHMQSYHELVMSITAQALTEIPT